ncbi:Ribonuclease Z [uncultured archaeon]|nr:Ribonuclease Z [uncultured archaeon]
MTLRLVVLGSGAAVPSPERSLTSVAMRYEGDVYLFDCGEGAQRQMMKCGISYAKVKAIFLSHLHGDHIFGIPGLVYTLRISERVDPLLIFGPPGTKKRVAELVGADVDFLKVEDISAGWAHDIGGAEIGAFETSHKPGSLGYVFEEEKGLRFDKEKCESLGMKGRVFKTIQEKGEVTIKGRTVKIADVTYMKEGKKIVFSGDTEYSKSLVKAAAGADVLFHEATFMEDMRAKAGEDKHSTVKDAAKAAKEAKVKKLILYHIGNRYKDMAAFEAEGKGIFRDLEAARDRMEILV